MRCSICKSNLILSDKKCYETLGDHVYDPNGTPPERDSYVCSNNECISHQAGGFWGIDGDFFYKDYKFFEHSSKHNYSGTKGFILECTSALDSFNRESFFYIYDETKISFYKKFPKFPLNIEISYYHFNIGYRIFPRVIRFQKMKKVDGIGWCYGDTIFNIWFNFTMLRDSIKETVFGIKPRWKLDIERVGKI